MPRQNIFLPFWYRHVGRWAFVIRPGNEKIHGVEIQEWKHRHDPTGMENAGWEIYAILFVK